MASGRKSAISTPSAASGTKSPFEVIEERKSGPRPARGAEMRTATAMRTGTAASTSRPIWLRRRPPMRPSSDHSRRAESRLDSPTRAGDDVGGAAGAGGVVTGSATDIETLPGQGHEEVLEARPADGELLDADPALHEGGDDLLRLDTARLPANPSGYVREGVDAELGHDPGCLGRLVGDAPGHGCRCAAHLRGRALGHQPALAHDSELGAHLLHLGEQVAGHEHGRAVRGERRDELAHLARALWVQSVRGL